MLFIELHYKRFPVVQTSFELIVRKRLPVETSCFSTKRRGNTRLDPDSQNTLAQLRVAIYQVTIMDGSVVFLTATRSGIVTANLH